jgi:hypothetical protein
MSPFSDPSGQLNRQQLEALARVADSNVGWFSGGDYADAADALRAELAVRNQMIAGGMGVQYTPALINVSAADRLGNRLMGGTRAFGAGAAALLTAPSVGGFVYFADQAIAGLRSVVTGEAHQSFGSTVAGKIDSSGKLGLMYDALPGLGMRPSALVTGPRVANGAQQNVAAPVNTAATVRTLTVGERLEAVAQRAFNYAVENPRVPGLSRIQLGKDAEIQATRWLRRWAQHNDVPLGPGGLRFQVRGDHSIPDVVFDPTRQIFDFKLSPASLRPVQTENIIQDFPGYDLRYIYGPDLWR